jgi:hypothetical protein
MAQVKMLDTHMISDKLVTVKDMLRTRDLKHNQADLAKMLGVNRGTLRKYMNDELGERHCIRVFKGTVQLMVLTHGATYYDKD